MSTAAGSIHVLHVDDKPEVAELAAEFLEGENERLAVDTATSAIDGLNRLADTDYDCIVSDYNMPRQDGIEFLAAVRERHPDLPFILYTGKGTEAIASEAITAGVTDYLQKESGTDQYTVLANRITNCVAQSRASQKIERTRERQQRHREALIELLTDDAVTAGGFETAVRRVTETAADVLNVPRVNVWLVEDNDGETMLTCVDHYVEETGNHASGMELAIQEYPAYFEALETHRAIDATDARDDPRTTELTDDYLDHHGIDSVLDATLRSEGEPIGVICHEHVGGPREWTDDEIDFASNIADIIHRALRNKTRNEREQTLRKTTEQLQAVLDTVEAAIYIKDTEGRYQLMNQETREFIGIDPETEIVGRTDFDFLPDEVAAQAQADDQRVLENESTIEFEEDVPAAGGTQINLTRKSPFYDRDGNLRGICAVSTPITEQKERERALQRERDRQTALFENFQAAIAYYEFEDGEPVTKEINAVFEETFGICQEAATGQLIDDMIIPEEAVDEGKAINERVVDGELVDTDIVRQTDDGLRTFNLRSVPLEPGTSGERGFAIYSDITERNEREQELEQYETLVEATGDPMYILNDEGHFTYVNEALVETTGYSEETLLGEHVSKVMEEDHVERGEQLIRSLFSAGERRGTFEMDAVTASGERISNENHISLYYVDGEFHGSLGVLRDITDRLERERQLKRERDRLNEFAGVVSHDLRNPLNVAAGQLELATEDCASEHLDTAARSLDRMDHLIDDLLSLARAGETVGEMEAVELADLVETCWQTVETASAELVVDTETTIQADATRLKQLLENLMRNVVEHGGEDVTITIGDLPDGFSVEDDGPGIPDDERGSIFDAGYTTAKDGTGIGLSIVRRVAEAHGWEIEVTDGGDRGARFEVTGIQTDG